MVQNLGEKYTPLYFLAALGNGGMAVTFFIYLMFSVPHKGTPVVIFENWTALLGNAPIYQQALIIFAIAGIIYFGYNHIKLLLWNIKEYKLFKTTQAYQALKQSNAEVTLMAIPLTFAMTINVSFISGAVFIPGLWSVIDYLFPVALATFLTTGYYALSFFGDYFQRLLSEGNFNFEANNNMAQMIAILSFAMSAVGLAAVGAMSHNSLVYGIAMFGSIFFVVTSMMLAVLQGILGFTAMMKHGIGVEATPSLWIAIPILTLLGITTIRIYLGSSHNFLEIGHPTYAPLFVVTSMVVAMQIMSAVIGYRVMKQKNYFEDYIHGDKKSPVSLSLICPGVSAFVFGMFFVFIGLVQNGIFEMFSLPFWILVVPYILIWVKTLLTLQKISKKLLSE
jgi:hypothetical protein